jgi:hypothetical protein
VSTRVDESLCERWDTASPTPFSDLADLRLAAPAGEAIPKLTEEIRRCRRPA